MEKVLNFEIPVEGKRKIIKPKQVLFEENRNLALGKEGHQSFHAYGRGDVIGVYEELRDAVQIAYDHMGVVTDHNGSVVWERGNRKNSAVLELAGGSEPVEAADSLEGSLRLLLEQEGIYADVRNALDSGRSPYQILKQNS